MLNNFYKISMQLGHIICHQKPERSFFLKNHQFPVCARCTGILIGFMIALSLLIWKIYFNFWLALIFTLGMILDWLYQNVITKKNHNIRRLITGLIGGFGFSFFYYYIIIYIIRFF